MQFNALAIGTPHKMQHLKRQPQLRHAMSRRASMVQGAQVVAAHVGASMTPTPLSTYLQVSFCTFCFCTQPLTPLLDGLHACAHAGGPVPSALSMPHTAHPCTNVALALQTQRFCKRYCNGVAPDTAIAAHFSSAWWLPTAVHRLLYDPLELTLVLLIAHHAKLRAINSGTYHGWGVPRVLAHLLPHFTHGHKQLQDTEQPVAAGQDNLLVSSASGADAAAEGQADDTPAAIADGTASVDRLGGQADAAAVQEQQFGEDMAALAVGHAAEVQDAAALTFYSQAEGDAIASVDAAQYVGNQETEVAARARASAKRFENTWLAVRNDPDMQSMHHLQSASTWQASHHARVACKPRPVPSCTCHAHDRHAKACK